MSKALIVPAAVTPLSPYQLAETLVTAGAILTLAGLPVRRHLVGHLAWLGPGRMFWFTAHGDTPDDGHVLEFDDAHGVADQWVCFYHRDKLAACLAAIPAAGVEDPDDYLIAWQLWHEVAPRRARLIRDCLSRLGDAGTADEMPAARGGVVEGGSVAEMPKRRGGISGGSRSNEPRADYGANPE